MNVYIAGKITGQKEYKQKFKEAEDTLHNMGHLVMNPAILPAGFSHMEYMRICFSMLDACDAVYMLDNWHNSPGACMEFEYAKMQKKTIYYQNPPFPE